MDEWRRSFVSGYDSSGRLGTLLEGRTGPNCGEELADEAGVDCGDDRIECVP